METSSPTKEIEEVTSSESKSESEENKTECSPDPPACDSNVEKTKMNALPSQSEENSSNNDKNTEQSGGLESQVEKAPDDETRYKLLNKDPVQGETDVTAKNIEAVEVISVQLLRRADGENVQQKAEGVETVQQKADEAMETGENGKSIVEVDAPANIAAEETQNDAVVTSSTEGVSEQNQDSNETIESSDSDVESIPNVDAEVIDISAPSPEKPQEPTNAVAAAPSGSLSLLAEYDSGNDSDVCEVPSMQNYQNRVVEIDSATSSSSSSEDEEEDNEPIDVELLSAIHADDEEEETVRSSKSPRVRGEFHLDDLPPIHELQITVPEEECTELGKIQSIVEQLVIVNSLPGTVPLDLDTILFLDKGKKILGEIFDVLGQVSDPMYCVRFNSNKDIKAKGIEVGQTVYVAPRTEHTQFVILSNLMKEKGSDASWEYDIEPPERYLDYSDDEEERNARRTVRNKNRPMEGSDEAPKRYRPADSPSPSGSRPYRENHYDGGRVPPFRSENYRFTGNSWHSNYHPHVYNGPPQYAPYGPPRFYRPPPRALPHRPPMPPHPGMIVNPYAMYPPPHLMQQPLFPPPMHHPPPPPPPGTHGGY